MKGFLVLLCALAAVQARNTGLATKSEAALGENPWVVHLRYAVSTSGLLSTCGGSLIHQSWALTGAQCLVQSRFIWIRYGVVNVISPNLVTEASQVRTHNEFNPATGDNNIGLININRVIQFTENISPVSLALPGTDAPSSGTYCGFGVSVTGEPAEILNCFTVGLEEDGNKLVASSDEVSTYESDIGSSLVVDGVQYGILSVSGSENSVGEFLPVANYFNWIEAQSGVQLRPDPSTTVAPEADDDDETYRVNFVN